MKKLHSFYMTVNDGATHGGSLSAFSTILFLTFSCIILMIMGFDFMVNGFTILMPRAFVLMSFLLVLLFPAYFEGKHMRNKK